MSVRETVSRLEEDVHTLCERNLKDQETTQGLLEEMGAKEREFIKKIVELKVENRDFESGKKVNQWRTRCAELEGMMSKLKRETAVEYERQERELREKLVEIVERNRELEEKVLRLYEENSRLIGEGSASKAAEGKVNNELEARILKLVAEKFQLVEKEKGVEREIDDEVPNRGVKLMPKEDLLLTPESRRKRVRIVDDSAPVGDDEGKITHGQFDKRLAEAAHSQVPPGSANCAPKEIKVRRLKKKIKVLDLSCPSTTRNPGSTSRNGEHFYQVGDIRVGTYHKRKLKNEMNPREYTGRIPSDKQIQCAKKRAETLQSHLRFCNPTFIKSMAWSHVSGGFWLSLPREFYQKNLPSHEQKMILEDENGLGHEVNYMSDRTGLSGGWRGFALDHNLERGDAVMFELCKPTKFKVYIIKAIPEESRK